MLIVYPGLLEKLRTAALPAAVEEFRTLYFPEIVPRFPIDSKVYFAGLGIKETNAPTGQVGSIIQLSEDQKGFQAQFYKSEYFLKSSQDLQNILRVFALGKLFLKLLPQSLSGAPLRQTGLMERLPEKLLDLILKGSKSTHLEALDQRGLDFGLSLLIPEVFLQKCKDNSMADQAIASFFGVTLPVLGLRLGNHYAAQYSAEAQVGKLPDLDRKPDAKAAKSSPSKTSLAADTTKQSHNDVGLDRLKSGEGMKRLRLLAKKLSDEKTED